MLGVQLLKTEKWETRAEATVFLELALELADAFSIDSALWVRYEWAGESFKVIPLSPLRRGERLLTAPFWAVLFDFQRKRPPGGALPV